VWPILESPFFRKCCSPTLILLTFLLPGQSTAAADTNPLDDAILVLADRVAAIPDLHGPLRLEFATGDGVAASPGKTWQESFKKELEARHLGLTEEQSAPPLRVALTATPTQWILVASVRSSDHDEVRLVSLPRASIRLPAMPAAPLRIERQLVFESPERILDACSWRNGSEGGIVLLAYRNGQLTALQVDRAGAVKQFIPIPIADPQPSRDPRGELSAQGTEVEVLLPAKNCSFGWASPGEVKCRAVKPVWRGTTVLTPPCDPAGWKIVSDGRDWTVPEMFQVVPDSSAREGGTAILSELPGPILNVNGEQNPASALVVTRNLHSGNYEVYRITLACGN
jgi:hypothetical protein